MTDHSAPTRGEVTQAGKPASKIKFEDERQRYTVMACDERYVVLVKPFNARRTYLYTIVDLARGVRGRCNRIFGIPHDVSTPAGAAAVLAELQTGSLEVSRRHCESLRPMEIISLRNLGRGV